MIWFHRFRQRLSLTRNEALTLIVLSSFFSAGLIVRHFQLNSQPVPPDAYEEMDRLFFERSAAGRSSDEEAAYPIDSSAGSGSTLHSTDSPNRGGAAARPTDAPNGSGAPARPTDPPAEPGGRIDLNHASAAELERLPRVGPKTAQRIITFRETYGPFRHVDDLIQVRGIGPKTLEQIRPLATVTLDSLTTDRRRRGAPSR